MPISSLINGRRGQPENLVSNVAAALTQFTANKAHADQGIGAKFFATESLSSDEAQLVLNAASSFETNIANILQDLGVAAESFQIDAAAQAGLMGTNPRMGLVSKLRSVGPDVMVIGSSVTDGGMDRGVSLESYGVSLEAYDERENRNAQLQSMVYNLLASRQDEFGETLFPTIIINSNDVGIQIAVKLFYVYNDFKRSVTGAKANYGRVSILRAYADANVLKNELTRAIPVLRTGGGADDNSDKFAPIAEIPGWQEEIAPGQTVFTGALKVDQRVDLLGLSQTNELLASGLMGPSDSLDTFIRMDAVYLRVSDGTHTDVIRIDTSNLPTALFTYSVQGNTRKMALNLDSDGIVLDSQTVTTLGGAPQVLTELASNKIRLMLSIGGNVYLDKAELSINRGAVSLDTMRNNAGQLITGAAFEALADKLITAEVYAFNLRAYRANSNIRQRGRLLDSQTSLRVVQVPYRAPFAVLAPTLTTNPEDTTALETLVTSTGARISNDAVTALLQADARLSVYKAVPNANGDLPEISDLGFSYVKPTYYAPAPIALPVSVDSLASHERLKDIRAALVEQIRFYANEMWRTSEYQPAAQVLTGNVNFRPTVIVATDPVLYNYIMTEGELRTLGETFDMKVVATIDSRVKGNIFITFGVFDATRNTAVNPLNSGNMLYSSELVSNMPVSRDGQVSNEVMTVPRYLHIWNLPVMTKLTVTGLPEVISKVAVNTHQV